MVKKASDRFGRAKKVIPTKESMMEEVVEGIRFGLLMFGGGLVMVTCSDFPQTVPKMLKSNLAMRKNKCL